MNIYKVYIAAQSVDWYSSVVGTTCAHLCTHVVTSSIVGTAREIRIELVDTQELKMADVPPGR